jgi:hypothetical protein
VITVRAAEILIRVSNRIIIIYLSILINLILKKSIIQYKFLYSKFGDQKLIQKIKLAKLS